MLRYFAGEVEFGVVSQATFAFNRISAALSVIVKNLDALSGLAAETERLVALTAALVAAGARAEEGGGTPEDDLAVGVAKKERSRFNLAKSDDDVAAAVAPVRRPHEWIRLAREQADDRPASARTHARMERVG